MYMYMYSCMLMQIRTHILSLCVCEKQCVVLISHVLEPLHGSCHCQGCVERDDGTTFLQLFDREIGQMLRGFMPWGCVSGQGKV